MRSIWAYATSACAHIDMRNQGIVNDSHCARALRVREVDGRISGMVHSELLCMHDCTRAAPPFCARVMSCPRYIHLPHTCIHLHTLFFSDSPTPLEATIPTWELMGVEIDIPPSNHSRWEAYTAPCVAPEPASDVSQPTSPHSGIGTRP